VGTRVDGFPGDAIVGRASLRAGPARLLGAQTRFTASIYVVCCRAQEGRLGWG